ncbi:hypothetical protein AN189_06285 [Loktanella sp. 3ANDIMAR09]|uniref:ion channel n=1 Tax=Loktanella sp. 3ANDIMAR09 TaxID=1225657 RepID=UPI0006FD1387|nr:ion channel [Loktanella sp. 3ANDIMAR09]KQI69174.1 hypothetical protein AN189_06285 [Loktanella sp. 3ANDIMAR09]
MILALIIGIALVNLGALLHFYALKAGARAINPDRHPVKCFMFSIQIIIVSHLLIAAIFAGSFHAAETWWHLGTLSSANNMADPLTFMDRFYFSLVNYTTLGRGDLIPTGHLRVLTAMEALLGFLVITGSGAFLLRVIFGRNP